MAEFDLGYFGDVRLQKKGRRVLEGMCASLCVSLRRTFGNRTQQVGATRFFRNPKVMAGEMSKMAAARTNAAAAGRHVLIVQDTSELDFVHLWNFHLKSMSFIMRFKSKRGKIAGAGERASKLWRGKLTQASEIGFPIWGISDSMQACRRPLTWIRFVWPS
jgi:hypothetical protein